MAKNILITLIVIIIILCLSFLKKSPITPLDTTKIILNNHEYQIEIAHTNQQKEIGLSNRNSLCSNCGMIFLFEKDKILPFWMKNTLIPLDIIWINSNNKITDIIIATETNSLKILQNTQIAKYVLELNAFDAQKIGLKVGDYINLPNNL